MYDRASLLAGEKRNSVLELWEVRRYGIDSFADANYVSIYGMQPKEWYAKGVRLLGRTVVECTRDALAAAIASDVAALAAAAPPVTGTAVLDPFAGSGNTLYWLLRYLPGARSIGFEVDDAICRLTRRNFASLALPIEIQHADYRAGLAALDVPADHLLIVFIAPPWGDALDPVSGLDLRRTAPPVVGVVERLRLDFPRNPLLCAVQIYERVYPGSVDEVASRCDWSAVHTYDLNTPGQNHGLLLLTHGWCP